jgi:hypothetical protein
MTDWSVLKHAYGSAEEIPLLLEQLSANAEDEVWNKLWSCLCHQGTVYSASFAALPVLAEYAESCSPWDRVPALLLAGAILASDDVQGTRDELLRPYRDVLEQLRALCGESLAQAGIEQSTFIYLLEAMCSFESNALWGRKLNHLAGGEFPASCPGCTGELFIVIGQYGFFTAASQDWIHSRTIKRIPIRRNDRALPGVGARLHQYAKSYGQDELADWFTYLFGASSCPSCKSEFQVHEVAIAD